MTQRWRFLRPSAQLVDCGIVYFEGGLCYPVYGDKQISVLRNGCEVLEKKNNQILKRLDFTSSYLDLFVLERNMVC